MIPIILALITGVLTLMTTFMTVKIIRKCNCKICHFQKGKCKLCHLKLNTQPAD